jgi:nicotinamide-nucleotide amidase
MMIAEILATGDEIRSGSLVDSNSAHIAEALERSGVVVTRHQSVGDDLDVLISVIDEISHRADIVVVTGGLGPTVDDRSAEAAAKACGVPLTLDSRALDDIRQFFEERGRPISPSNRKQAMLPQGSDVLYNPVGTAPGFGIKIQSCTFFFLPGVPYEMKRMLGDQVLPRIEKMQGGKRRYNLVRTLSSFGLPESMVGEKVDGVTREFPEIILGLRAKFPEIQVKLYLSTSDEPAGQALLAKAAQWVGERLGDHLFSYEGRSMADEVGRLLTARKATLAVAESCTGGLIGNWLTNSPGASQYFNLSAVTYHNQAKSDILGVGEQTLSDHGAVSEETAKEMAQGARRAGRSTFAVATTGIAGPDGGSDDKPVGTICIAVATPERTLSLRLRFNFGKRLMNKRMFAMAALDLLRRELQKPEDSRSGVAEDLQ